MRTIEFSSVGFAWTRTAGGELPQTPPAPRLPPATASAARSWPPHRTSGAVENVRGQRQNHDRRIGRVDLAIRRIARQVRRQLAARRIDGRLHVARRGIDIPVQIELQRDAGAAELLDEVISVTPAMRPNCRSSGVATDEAIVSGLAPGNEPKLRCRENPPPATATPAAVDTPVTPASASAERSSDVPTGRLIKGAERFTGLLRYRLPSARSLTRRPPLRQPVPNPIERQINHRRRIKRQHLAEDQTADDRDSQRPPQLRADAAAERQRQRRRTAPPSSSS